METIEIAYKSNDYSEAPDELENVATTHEIQIIKDIVNKLWGTKTHLFSVNIDVVLFQPTDDEWRWDVGYVTAYLPPNGEIKDVRVYQYFQNKYDASDNIESESFTLGEVEEHLSLILK